MTRVPRRYAIHLLLSSGREEVVHFTSLETFQQWYTSALHSGTTSDAFVNVSNRKIAPFVSLCNELNASSADHAKA